MLRITGNMSELLRLAERTGSTPQLMERLEYLEQWGDGHGCNVNVDMNIVKVNLDREEADVQIRFYGIDCEYKPAAFPLDPKPTMFGGLNLIQATEDGWNWSINT